MDNKKMKSNEETINEIEHSKFHDDEDSTTTEENVNRYGSKRKQEASEISESVEEDKKKAIWKEIVSWIEVIVAALVLSLLLNKYIIFNFKVPTESMENTIMTGSHVISLRCAYWFSDPDRLDIVVFPFPDNPEEKYIKRVIGLPGETIEGKDGIVYIDGEPLEEEAYITSDLDEDFGPYTIPEDSYFVLGDNRDASKDARYWENKFVKREDIISKAVMKFYPGIKLLK